MTREEAEIKKKEYEAAKPGYCPLIRSTCYDECVCYVPPRVQNNYRSYSAYGPPDEGRTWTAYGRYCSSPMIAKQEE